MSVQVSYKKQFFILLFSILIVIIGLEGIAHIFDIFYPHCVFPDKDAMKELSVFTASQLCLDHNKIKHYLDVILLFEPNQHYSTVNINSHGFRGSEISLIKPDDTYRIFMVGGSTTFGTASTSDQATIPGYLEKKINESEINFNVEVINAGIGGADSARELYYINNVLQKFNPDMYIIYDGYNDAVRELEFGEFGVNERVDVFGSSQNNKDGFKFSNYPQYRTPYMIYDILFYHVDGFDVDRYVNPNDYNQKAELWKNRQITICKTHEDVKTIISVHPVLGSGNKQLSHDELLMLERAENHKTILKTIELMSNSLEELNNYCDKTMDLRNVFDNINEPINYDLAHINDKGNKIIADKLFNEIYPIILKEFEKSG